MPKKVLLVVLSVFMLILTGCESSEVRELREKYPGYFQLDTFKGIELYVWETAEGSYHCGMMTGTNRYKTDEEIWELFSSSVNPGEAKTILSTYPDDTYVSIIPVIQPASSYSYEIDDSYQKKIAEVFGADDNYTTAGEITK